MKENDFFSLSGQIVDVVSQTIFPGTIIIKKGKIDSIKKESVDSKQFILPGLIDAHVHIESSMLIPSEFAKLATTHGTVATVSDPHEIANVLGVEGVRFMIKNGKKVPFKFYFGASSCVPATPFETSGAVLGSSEIESLLKLDEIKYLAEVMNFPGVLNNDAGMMDKINIAKKYNKNIDGHAPGLKGESARKYADAGITTDHECFTLDEAIDKIKAGMKIQIREGSAAKNFDALIELLNTYPDSIMFCSDDKHPNDLMKGHINQLVKKALAAGYDFMKVLRACTFNPIKHYQLEVGLVQQGDDADFIVVDDLQNFNVLSTYIKGIKVAENKTSLIQSVKEEAINKFVAQPIIEEDIKVKAEGTTIKIIGALEGQLITKKYTAQPKLKEGYLVSDIEKDILKIVVLNRYQPAKPSVAFINNFGLREGAIASTVAHDSHNIIAIGVDDKDIVEAINMVIEHKGGISLVVGNEKMILPLPVAGLMSVEDGYHVANQYDLIDKRAKMTGSKLLAPYMTMSFMALLVIPELKLSDKGLFDGTKFEFTPLFEK